MRRTLTVLAMAIALVLPLSACAALDEVVPQLPGAPAPATEPATPPPPAEEEAPAGEAPSEGETAPPADDDDEVAPDEEAPAGEEESAPPADGSAAPAADIDVSGTADGVTVAAPEGAAIYVDGAFTGVVAPADVALDGTHTVGVGTEAGQFVEYEVDAGGATATVGEGEVVTNRPWKVAIVPVRTTVHGSGGAQNTGIVTDTDVELVTEQLEATGTEMVEPYSYGTASWDIDVLPMVEDVPLHRASGTGEPPDGGRLIEEAGLTSVNEDYDFHVIFYGVLTEDGQQVDDEPCCLWGGGNSVALNNGWNVRDRGPEPFEGFLHEWLHVVEQRHSPDAVEPVSEGGLHGAQETVGEDGSQTSQWLNAYQQFMRSQVAENGTHTGVFSTLRAGPQ